MKKFFVFVAICLAAVAAVCVFNAVDFSSVSVNYYVNDAAIVARSF